MTNNEFNTLISAFRKEQDKLIINKGNDYTNGNGEADRLYNFKWVAEQLGLTPLQVLGVYWLKHVLAIMTFIKEGKLESEGIESRLLDENNYNLLMKALIDECENNRHCIKDKGDMNTLNTHIHSYINNGVCDCGAELSIKINKLFDPVIEEHDGPVESLMRRSEQNQYQPGIKQHAHVYNKRGICNICGANAN